MSWLDIRVVKIVGAAVLYATVSLVHAQANDETCRNWAGMFIDSPECRSWRDANPPMKDIDCANDEACRNAAHVRAERRRQRNEAIKQSQLDAIDRATAEREHKAASREAALKASCGTDYKAPRIGMSIDRAQQCVTVMRVTGQLNRADGVITTYQGGGAYFHVMDGRIVAWGK